MNKKERVEKAINVLTDNEEEISIGWEEKKYEIHSIVEILKSVNDTLKTKYGTKYKITLEYSEKNKVFYYYINKKKLFYYYKPNRYQLFHEGSNEVSRRIENFYTIEAAVEIINNLETNNRYKKISKRINKHI